MATGRIRELERKIRLLERAATRLFAARYCARTAMGARAGEDTTAAVQRLLRQRGDINKRLKRARAVLSSVV